jgi:hypothetical protein
VDAPFVEELGLGGVPKRIVSAGEFELLEGIKRITFVVGVVVKRFLDPGRERGELVAIVAMSGEIETDFSPGDELVEKSIGGGTHVPPALAAAIGAQGKFCGFPLFAASQFTEDFVDGKMAEMEEGRQSAGDIVVGIVAEVGIAGEICSEKTQHAGASAGVTAAEGCGVDGMVDGQSVERGGLASEESFGGDGPVGGDFSRKRRRGKRFGLGERVRMREMAEMWGQLFLEVASKIESPKECLASGANWEQAVRVDGFQSNSEFFCGGRGHARKKETREIVGDNHAGVLRESREEAFARAGRGFDVRIIAHAARLAGQSIVRHSVDHKAVKAIAGPRVADAQSFENKERLGQCGTMLECAIECEIGMKAASGDHPIEDVIGRGPRGIWIAVTDADGGNSGQGDFVLEKSRSLVSPGMIRRFSLQRTAGGR